MKRFFSVIALVVFSNIGLYSQNIAPYFLNSGGEVHAGNSLILEFSVGQITLNNSQIISPVNLLLSNAPSSIVTTLKNDLTTDVLELFPNPSADKICMTKLQSGSYSIKKTNGQMVQSGALPATGCIDISGISSGVYVVLVYDTDQLLILKHKQVKI